MLYWQFKYITLKKTFCWKKEIKIKLDRELANIFISKNGFIKDLLIPKSSKALCLMNLSGFEKTQNKKIMTQNN